MRLVEMTGGLGRDVRFLDFARNDRELGRDDRRGVVEMTRGPLRFVEMTDPWLEKGNDITKKTEPFWGLRHFVYLENLSQQG